EHDCEDPARDHRCGEPDRAMEMIDARTYRRRVEQRAPEHECGSDEAHVLDDVDRLAPRGRVVELRHVPDAHRRRLHHERDRWALYEPGATTKRGRPRQPATDDAACGERKRQP